MGMGQQYRPSGKKFVLFVLIPRTSEDIKIHLQTDRIEFQQEQASWRDVHSQTEVLHCSWHCGGQHVVSSTLETELQLLADWSLSHKKNDEDYKGALLLDRSANCYVTSTVF